MSDQRSEDERQQSIQQHMAELQADIDDPDLSDYERQESAELLKRYIEDRQVEALYNAAKQDPNPQISSRRDYLVMAFMSDHAETLAAQNQPQTIGTPAQFREWLSKPIS